jgi:Glucanosyltransferase
MPPPIGPNDIITVQGQYLYNRDGTRFFMKGIAFPVSSNIEQPYNATAWIGILQQLHTLHLDHYNTVRIYRMDPSINYSAFFHAAAALGIYIIVPLTAETGPGVLSRDADAPTCYRRALLRYGASCLQNYLQYPNALAGLVANEVMNSRDSWNAAPCIKAYARDLKIYMKFQLGNGYRPLPLIYAAQHSAIWSNVGNVGTMLLTLNYLTCKSSSLSPSNDNDHHNQQLNVMSSSSSSSSSQSSSSSSSSEPPIDIFGVNVESWCSSLNTFVFNEDGKSAGSYYSLWLGLHDSTVPLVMTEMGCSHAQFDKDNGRGMVTGGTRDWSDVSVVLHEMSDTWSGFCAYAYHGNAMFNMFTGGPWRGSEPLEPLPDFFNFRDALQREAEDYDRQNNNNTQQHFSRDPPLDYERVNAPTCEQVEDALRSCCSLDLYPYTDIPSFALLLDVEGAAAVAPRLHDDDDDTHDGSSSSSSSALSEFFNNTYRPSWSVAVSATGFVIFVMVGMLLKRGWRSISSRYSTYQTIAEE